MSNDDSSTRSWNNIADDWVAHADTNDYRNLFLFPLTFTLLGDLHGRRVLDLGCGEGGYSREMARRGAKVVAVDGSERLIEVARERARDESLAVESICRNASSMEGIVSESFDLVLASMSLMDVEDYDGAVRECHRVLVRGGDLLMSITHPCFSAPVSEWIRDDQGQPQVFTVDRYFERTAWESIIARDFSRPVLRRHRPLEDYMRAPIESGFILRDFREPQATEDDVKKSRRFTKITRVPYFLFLRWQKS
jgi:2-polyprenyl-3-methyl-5-hydroxy-6-metoxy-1,4-benzoquinol methylase